MDKVSAVEAVIWTCPRCDCENQSPGHTTTGDEVMCEHCSKMCEIADITIEA